MWGNDIHLAPGISVSELLWNYPCNVTKARDMSEITTTFLILGQAPKPLIYHWSEESKSITTVLSNLPLGYACWVYFEHTWRKQSPSSRSADTAAYQDSNRACSKSTALKHKIWEAFKEQRQKASIAILEQTASVAEVKGYHQSLWHSESHFLQKCDDSTAGRTAVM